MNFNDFTLQRNMIFDDFPDPFRYKFWHWFLMSFGIDLGSLFKRFFHVNSCFFRHRILHWFFKAFWTKNKPKWLPKYLMRSPFLAPKIDIGAQGDFWMHFGRLSVPFCMLWASFESLWAPFCCLLRPFGYLSGACWYLFAPPPPFWHPFRSIFLLFLMLRICCRFLFIWIACGSVFGRTPNANTFLGHPTPQDPQQNYSRISTVGTPTLLGPGRACCRRQLKIDG